MLHTMYGEEDYVSRKFPTMYERRQYSRNDSESKTLCRKQEKYYGNISTLSLSISISFYVFHSQSFCVHKMQIFKQTNSLFDVHRHEIYT